MLGDRRYCYLLTVIDHASGYLLLCEAMESNAEKTALTAFERLFQERGEEGQEQCPPTIYGSCRPNA